MLFFFFFVVLTFDGLFAQACELTTELQQTTSDEPAMIYSTCYIHAHSL